MNRLTAFAMWLLGFVCPTDIYLRMNGYDPKMIEDRFDKFTKDLFREMEQPNDN